MIELSDAEAKIVDKVHTGAILVDGLGVGDVGNIVLRDRQHLAEDGILIVVLTLEKRQQQSAGRTGYRIQRICLCKRIRRTDGRSQKGCDRQSG